MDQIEVNPRVIVVLEADTDVASLYQQIFSPEYIVNQVSSMDRLLSMMTVIKPNLLVSNHESVGISTSSFIRKFQSTDLHLKVPTILMTSKKHELDRYRWFRGISSEILLKPIETETLYSVARTLISTNIRDSELETIGLSVSEIVESKLSMVSKSTSIVTVINEFTNICKLMIDGFSTDLCSSYFDVMWKRLLMVDHYYERVCAWTDLTASISKLHDIGKIGISKQLLDKPMVLNKQETDEIREHVDIGSRLINRILSVMGSDNTPLADQCRKMTLDHHEHWSGGGYPRKLVGANISLEGRVMSIIDTYDALTSFRWHRVPYSHEQAVEMIVSSSFDKFDPALIEIFIDVEKEFKTILTGGSPFSNVIRIA